MPQAALLASTRSTLSPLLVEKIVSPGRNPVLCSHKCLTFFGAYGATGYICPPSKLEVAPSELEVAPSELDVVPSELDVAPSELEVAPLNTPISQITSFPIVTYQCISLTGFVTTFPRTSLLCNS